MSRAVRQQRDQASLRLIRYLYKGIHGIELSNAFKNRSRLENDSEGSERAGAVDDKSLTYGEIVPESFVQILTHCIELGGKTDQPKKLTFVDLGSGTGKALFTAALSSTGLFFSKVWGIEIVPDLNCAADLIRDKFLRLFREDSRGATVTNNSSSAKGKELRSKKPGSTAGKLKSSSVPQGSDLLQEVVTIFWATSKLEMKADDLANKISHKIGHKIFRNHLKQYKSFKKFIQSHSTQLSYSVEDDTIRLIGDMKIMDPTSSPAVIEEEVAITDGIRSVSNEPTKTELLSIDSVESTERSSLGIGMSDQISDFMERFHDLSVFEPLPDILVQEGDIFEIEWWEEADIVYVASLLFSDDLMSRLYEKVLLMKRGSKFVTLRPLPIPIAETREAVEYVSEISSSEPARSGSNRPVRFAVPVLESESFYKMSWRMAKIYIYQII